MSAPDVVIVGGGFVGMAAAAALADGRRRIVVLEARAGADPRFRGELIHPHGAGVLADLGLHAPLARAGGFDVRGFAVVPGAGADAVLLPYDDVGGLPSRGLSMDHHAMVAALRAEVRGRPGVEVRTGARVTGLVREGAHGRVAGVETAEGERVLADLTIVAEGRHSKLRSQLGIAEEVRLLSFTAALLLDDVEVPNPRHGHVFLGAPGPVLAYSIGAGRVRMCVDIPASAEKGRAAILDLLQRSYAPFVPEPLRTAMLRAARAEALELCANHAIHTRRCAGPGFALVGDSGGCCHPLTATGLTTGLNDVRVLAEELGSSAGTPASLDAALLRYQRRRYRFVRAREILADALYEVFRGEGTGPLAVQNGIVRYWQGSARARMASMALLSGQESRLSAFLTEYARVVGRSAFGVLHGGEPTLSARAASLSGLLRLSYEKLERSLVTVYQDAIG